MGDDIITEVLNEREHQNGKWGRQDHHPMEWMNILMEEVGEAAKAALEVFFKNSYPQHKSTDFIPYENYRKEMIQVAAVAIAAIESLDRQGMASEQRL